MSKYPTSSSSRRTPPFFQFESVKQSLRISLPSTNANNQLSTFNKSNLTNRNDTTSRSSNISTIEKSKNKKKKNEKTEKIDSEKVKKQKDKGTAIKQQYDERLDSQFTFKRVIKTQRFTEHNTERNAQRHTQQNKKNSSVKKSSSCKKSTKKGQKSKSKAKQKLNLTTKLKYLNVRLKNDVNTPLNLTETWNRHSLDLKQVHTLHTSRTLNNRSYNLNSKDKNNFDERKGMSQQLMSNRKNKSVSQKSQNLSKGKDQESRDRDSLNLLRLNSKNQELKRKIYSNSSLSSFDYCQFSPKFENEFTQQFSKQFPAFPNSEQTQRFDSEEQQLLTMVSQDTQRIRSRMINKKQTPQRSSRNRKKQSETDRKEQPPVDSDFKKKSVKFQNDKLMNIDETENKSKDLLSVIDTALIKFTSRCANENDTQIDEGKQWKGSKQRAENKNKAKDDQMKNMQVSKNNEFLSMQTEGKQQSLMSFKRKQEPIIQSILDNRLTENLLSQDEYVNTSYEQPAAGRMLKRNNENEKLIKMKKSFDVDEKWKEDEIQRIQKAKNLVMMGLFESDTLLGVLKPKRIGNFSSESTKLLLKKGEKEQNLSKNSLKRKCKSLLNLQKQFSLSSLKVPKTSEKKILIIKPEEVLSPEQFLNKPLKRPQVSQKSESSESIIDDTFIEPNQQDLIQSKLPDYETDFNIDFSKTVVNPPKSNFNSPIEHKHQPSEESDYEVLFEQSKIGQDFSGAIRELKDISKDEAQEIFQFMFIDLLLDFIQEIEINFSKPTQLFSFIKSHKTEVVQKSATKIGFNTGPKQIILLLQKLSKFLQQTKDKETTKTYKDLIFSRIQEPIGPKASELLRYMREDEDQDFEVNQNEASDYEQKSLFALNIGWFQEFSKAEAQAFNFGVYYPQDKQKQAKRVSFLKSAMHIHTKALFDSINETIDKYRPYGLIGQPFPWKAHFKPAPINKSSFHKILNKTFEEVVESCRFLCGIFIEQHLSYKLSEKEHKQLAEDRLNKLLCKDVEQTEGRWSFIDDQETEILVDTAKYVSKQLALQFCKQLREIRKNRNQI